MKKDAVRTKDDDMLEYVNYEIGIEHVRGQRRLFITSREITTGMFVDSETVITFRKGEKLLQ